MNIYHANYPGRALGGVMIIIAHNKQQATRMAREALPAVDPEKIRIERKKQLETIHMKASNPVMPQIVYDWDGDY